MWNAVTTSSAIKVNTLGLLGSKLLFFAFEQWHNINKLNLPKTVTEVVPSPTSSSWTLDISTNIFAAGLSTPTDFNIVAPSFVTSTWNYINFDM